MVNAADLVRERVRREGPLRFDQVVEVALYHPDAGFYETGGEAGRRQGHFLSSPELGPLFGEVVGRALDRWWEELGRPDPYVVVDAGAGTGTLGAAVANAGPSCSAALRYLMVERSARLRRHHRRRLSLEPPGLVLGPAVPAGPDSEPRPAPGGGPLFASLAELPAGPFQGVVIANELLDNLPFRLLEFDGAWSEVRVDERLAEVVLAAPPEVASEASRLVDDPPSGGRIPLQEEAGRWLRAALACLSGGRVVVVDYADETASMCRRPWREWLRTYRDHGRGGHPLADLGQQDITCEVALDQLRAVRAPDSESTQADFLRQCGIESLAEDARQRWQARAHIGDLAAVRARSRVHEAAALVDPGGLGGFRVLEWAVGQH